MNNSEFEKIDEFLRKIGVGRRDLRDPFFDETYERCRVFRRIGVTVEDDEELCHPVMKEFQCNGPHCRAVFNNLVDYEIHYNALHRYVCEVCKATKTNARLLEIHVQETHDSFFKVLSEKQSMYQCYVSECDEKFPNSDARQAHCVGVHKFPKKFSHERVQRSEKVERETMDVECAEMGKKKIFLNKSQRTKTFSRSNKVTTARNLGDSLMECNDDTQSSDDKTTDKDHEILLVDEKSAYKSSLVFIPRQVARKTSADVLRRKTTSEKNVLESDSLKDLADNLPNCTK